MQKHRINLGLIWLLLAIILPLPLILILNTGLVDSTSHLIAYDFGIFAYVWWLAIIYLSTRPQWIAKKIGIPSTYRMHACLAMMAIVAATIHKFTATTFHAIIRNTGNIAWYLEIVLIIFAIVFLSGMISDHVHAFRRIKKQLEQVVNHKLSLWIHRLNFVVIALIWLHVNVIPRIANVPFFTIVFDIYTVLFLALYAYQKFIKDADMNNGGEVVENTALTPNINELTIKLNPKSKEYHASDFYFVFFRDKKVSSESHPFSVSSKPNKDEVKFMIHRVGDFTKKINQVKKETKVHLDGPYGLFNSEIEASNDPIVLYALGTGIAPLISLAEQYAGQKDLHLIWSTGSKQDYLVDCLTKLTKNGVKVDQKQHRFTNEELKESLSDNEKKNGQFYIVGSAPVVLNVRKNLELLGIQADQLHDEHLTM